MHACTHAHTHTRTHARTPGRHRRGRVRDARIVDFRFCFRAYSSTLDSRPENCQLGLQDLGCATRGSRIELRRS
eukprot:3446156-Pyramimonas_sp.AAC.1